jgi:murein L,D-transpeptidase YcbB/YkuD
MARFIESTNLKGALDRHDWSAFARGYNGPLFARYSYDRRIAEAFVAYGGSADTLAYPFAAAAESALLSVGSTGPAVTRLQQCLTQQGYAADADGIFGARTAAALRRFQAGHGLAADGIAGPATFAALYGEVETSSGTTAA